MSLIPLAFGPNNYSFSFDTANGINLNVLSVCNGCLQHQPGSIGDPSVPSTSSLLRSLWKMETFRYSAPYRQVLLGEKEDHEGRVFDIGRLHHECCGS